MAKGLRRCAVRGLLQPCLSFGEDGEDPENTRRKSGEEADPPREDRGPRPLTVDQGHPATAVRVGRQTPARGAAPARVYILTATTQAPAAGRQLIGPAPRKVPRPENLARGFRPPRPQLFELPDSQRRLRRHRHLLGQATTSFHGPTFPRLRLSVPNVPNATRTRGSLTCPATLGDRSRLGGLGALEALPAARRPGDSSLSPPPRVAGATAPRMPMRRRAPPAKDPWPLARRQVRGRGSGVEGQGPPPQHARESAWSRGCGWETTSKPCGARPVAQPAARPARWVIAPPFHL